MAGSKVKTRVVGLLGGTGAGKSTVAAWLQKTGYPVIDADKVSRDLTRKGEEGYNAVINVFGNRILDGTGNIDRHMLASIVFSDDEELAKLEGVLHPLMIRAIENMIGEVKSDTVVLDCAVLLKPTFRSLVDEIWVVTAPWETRLQRIMQRDGITEEQAESRMNAQLTEKAMLQAADTVISNNGTAQELYFQLENILADRSNRDAN